MNKDFIAKEYRAMHAKNTFKGESLKKHLPEIRKIITEYGIKSLLDYGCGKAACHTPPLVKDTTLYDPYREPYDKKPVGTFDLVICTDVLEHVPEDEIGRTLVELMNYTNKVLFLAISTKPAKKVFSDGSNVHITVKPREWWESMLSTAKDIQIVRIYS